MHPRRPKAPAFSLIELLVSISVIGLLIALVLPVLSRARGAARDVMCKANLRQMGMALSMYMDDNHGSDFPRQTGVDGGRLWWFGFEPDSGPTAEGERLLDRTRARLFPYYQSADTIEVCPAYPRHSPNYKPKYTTDWTTYAHPLSFMDPQHPLRRSQVRRPSRTLGFIDASQKNFFQPPATPSHPLFEQWYYIQPGSNHALYHHAGHTNAVMFDGHAAGYRPDQPLDTTFPEAPLGPAPREMVLQLE